MLASSPAHTAGESVPLIATPASVSGRRWTGAALDYRLRISLASGGNGLSAGTQPSSRLFQEHTRWSCTSRFAGS
jgi:hypothetical protein